ncbi:MAG: hypothetical protein LKI87_06395 [Prevotella sp.]|nr:hypothetical protein [Prevotella sp.]MCI1686235.1 hypothetical protein [Prevotella sp.]MCI1848440.1 hypothetical protein [Prevotella sp.]
MAQPVLQACDEQGRGRELPPVVQDRHNGSPDGLGAGTRGDVHIEGRLWLQ